MYLQPLPAGWTPEGVYAAQALTAVLIGGSLAALNWRGPLEWVALAASEVGRYQRAGIR
jgi:hypothetical protein